MRSGSPLPLMLVPEWAKPFHIGLVWPDKTRASLLPFYAEFTTLLHQGNALTILHQPKASIAKIPPLNGISLLPVPINDIWTRDWGPIRALDRAGKKCYVRFRYAPSYLTEKESALDQIAGASLTGSYPCYDIPLVLDGGNLIHNGDGVLAMTNRVLKDNNLTEKKLNQVLSGLINFRQLILLPEEPGDATGHIDGMVRFLDKNTLVVGTYPEDYKEGMSYSKKITSLLSKKTNFKIKFIQNDHPSDLTTEGMASALGNHLNFLRSGNHVIMPAYSYEKEAAKLDLKKIKTIPVQLEGLDALAHLGGVLNCITCQLW